MAAKVHHKPPIERFGIPITKAFITTAADRISGKSVYGYWLGSHTKVAYSLGPIEDVDDDELILICQFDPYKPAKVVEEITHWLADMGGEHVVILGQFQELWTVIPNHHPNEAR